MTFGMMVAIDHIKKIRDVAKMKDAYVGQKVGRRTFVRFQRRLDSTPSPVEGRTVVVQGISDVT